MPRNADRLSGTTVAGRYRLERVLGRGGWGVVFEATELALARRVAIKMMADADPRRLQRFRQEAVAIAALRSRRIVQVYDFCEAEGEAPLLVMELVPGPSLHAVIRREHRLEPLRALRLGAQILEGLEVAHAAGVIHRDLKPANVIVTRDRAGAEQVKILDFGLAKPTADPEAVHTTAGVMLGTPAYMAPEQIMGAPVDARTDLYAMGACLFEMLAGAPPFGGPDLYADIVSLEAPSLVSEAPGTPPELAAVVARALAKNPASRYASAADMHDALRPLLAPLK